MIRYRDGKIVSTKGERFTQVTKAESEEMKKSYVNIPNFDYGYIWQRFCHCNIIISHKLTYGNVNLVAVTRIIICICPLILSLCILRIEYGKRTCACLSYSCAEKLALVASNSICANRCNIRNTTKYIRAIVSKGRILWR